MGNHTIAQLLVDQVKKPLEEKKNSALIIGEEISAYEQELLSATEKFYTLMVTTRLDENNFFAGGDTQDMQRVYAGMDAADKAFEEWSYLVGTLDDKPMRQLPQIVRQALDKYNRPVFEKMAGLWIDNRKITGNMLQQKDVGLELISTFKQETAGLVDAAKSRAMRSMLLLLLLGTISGIGISILTGLRVSRPIRSIVAMLKDIAEGEGDLTRRLDVNRSDELGEQAKWFNVFVEKIRAMIQEVAGITENLNGSSSTLSGLASQMSDRRKASPVISPRWIKRPAGYPGAVPNSIKMRNASSACPNNSRLWWGDL